MTDNSITQIAVKHGFSNSSTLLKHFKAHMKLTPSQFREKYKNLELVETINKEQKKLFIKDIYIIYHYIFTKQMICYYSHLRLKRIDIKLKETKLKVTYGHVIQIGDLEVLLIKRFRRQLLEAKHHIGVDHVLIKDPIKRGL